MYVLFNIVTRRIIGVFYDFSDAEIHIEEEGFDPDQWEIWYMEGWQ